ncbi:hypothetical protein MIT9_P0997 [Methylomarinovum caldicuralii]|uniref:MobA-like NTP transferase domain-containing protein n=1 Tax=Methylomarinovum caldicuralii TaxID=438856 RepID=A0AAU9C667_9GAMM|nr:nucleotidyltransferase family protein [Methylomarinovum caldicuralii]BCX81419.1 hypothetical protein MIT9_P0997 [Methylomarinovum caldicuralii]
MNWHAVVLAADRERANPVAAAAGAPCKSLVPLAGAPLLARVLAALEGCPLIEAIVLVGPAETIWRRHALNSIKPLRWLPPAASPSLSAWRGMETVPPRQPVLLTTSDLAFPDSAVFTEFCRRAQDSGVDLAVGLVPHRLVVRRFPGVRRTALRFADGPFCTCNLFAFLTPKGREFVHFWRRLEQQRKRPWRLIRELGAVTLVRYLLGRLTTAEVARQVEKKLGIRVRFVILEHPEAAVDIDTPEDLALARSWLEAGSAPGAR